MTNWKTTLVGILGSVATWFGTYTQNGGNLSDWKLWVFPVLILVFGYLSKDFTSTGTTTA